MLKRVFIGVVGGLMLGSVLLAGGCASESEQKAPHALTGQDRARPAFVQDAAGRTVPITQVAQRP